MTQVITSKSERFQWYAENKTHQSGFANILSGIDLTTNQPVAIKVVKHQSEVETESRILPKISSDYIVKFIAMDSYCPLGQKNAQPKKWKPIIVTELYNGCTLTEMLAKDARYKNGLPDDMILCLLKSLTGSLSALDAAGIQHRDISTHNIVSHKEPTGEMRWVLIDFGLATEYDKGAGCNLSHEGVAEYLPQKLFQAWILQDTSDEVPQEGVDLWMAGITLFCAATGRFPFQPFGYQPFVKCNLKVQQCHQVWGDMMKKKGQHSLWISQDSYGSGYTEHTDLPEDIPMSQNLRPKVECLLRILQEEPSSQQLAAFRSAVESILSNSVVQVYDLALSSRPEPCYLKKLDMRHLHKALDLNSAAQSVMLSSMQPQKGYFFYQGHHLPSESSLAERIPLHGALQGVSLAPTICQVNLNFIGHRMGSKDLDHIPDVEEPQNADWQQMKTYLSAVRWYFDHVPQDKQGQLLRETLNGVLEIVSHKAKALLQRGEHQLDAVDSMVKLCSVGLSEKWNKLLHFCQAFMAMQNTYQEILFGKQGLLIRLQQIPLVTSKQNHLVRLETLLVSCGEIVKRYESAAAGDDTEKSCLPIHISICYKNALLAKKIYKEAVKELNAVRSGVNRSLKKCVLILQRLDELEAALEQLQSLIRETLNSINSNAKQEKGHFMPSLHGGLMDILRKGRSFTEELRKLETTLSVEDEDSAEL